MLYGVPHYDSLVQATPSVRLDASHSCVILDDSILIDAPPTILPQLHAAGISSADITVLDDYTLAWRPCLWSPFLLLERRFITDRDGTGRLRIHLKASGIERMKTICDLAFPDTLISVIEERVEWVVSDIGEVGQWAYERFPVFHTPATEPHGYMLRDSNDSHSCTQEIQVLAKLLIRGAQKPML